MFDQFSRLLLVFCQRVCQWSENRSLSVRTRHRYVLHREQLWDSSCLSEEGQAQGEGIASLLSKSWGPVRASHYEDDQCNLYSAIHQSRILCGGRNINYVPTYPHSSVTRVSRYTELLLHRIKGCSSAIAWDHYNGAGSRVCYNHGTSTIAG